METGILSRLKKSFVNHIPINKPPSKIIQPKQKNNTEKNELDEFAKLDANTETNITKTKTNKNKNKTQNNKTRRCSHGKTRNNLTKSCVIKNKSVKNKSVKQ